MTESDSVYSTTQRILDNAAAGQPYPIKAVHIDDARLAHLHLITDLNALKPQEIRWEADDDDFAEYAQHLDGVMKAVAAYADRILGHLAYHSHFGVLTPSRCKEITDRLSDLASDLVGTVEVAGHDLKERMEWAAE